MKKIISAVLMVIMMLTLTACGEKAKQDSPSQNEKQVETTTDAKTLVVYFSWSGNTKKVANKIKEETNADIIRLIPKESYPDNYDDVVDKAKKEQEEGIRPELSTKIDNLSQYDTIFIGYPNWWYDMPMILYTFFDEYDFSGKTIIPFCTNGGSGLSDTVNTIKDKEQKAKVLDGFEIRDNKVDECDEAVSEWLDKLNIKF